VKTSARNHLPGTVKSVSPGAVNTEVTIALDGGGEIVAIVTDTSARSLGLVPGARATALVKPSDVIVAVHR
jgi:molybdate transport system regulatory protein